MSQDAGNSWEPINNGLENLRGDVANNVAVNLVIDCNGEYLCFGTMYSGVWKVKIPK